MDRVEWSHPEFDASRFFGRKVQLPGTTDRGFPCRVQLNVAFGGRESVGRSGSPEMEAWRPNPGNGMSYLLVAAQQLLYVGLLSNIQSITLLRGAPFEFKPLNFVQPSQLTYSAGLHFHSSSILPKAPLTVSLPQR